MQWPAPIYMQMQTIKHTVIDVTILDSKDYMYELYEKRK